MDKFTPYQLAFVSELLSNGKLEEFQTSLLQDLAVNFSTGLTPELALQIFHVWLVYMLTCEFPEGLLINANNSSKIFYCDKIVKDGIQLIRNWFHICSQEAPHTISEQEHKEIDIYLKLKWRLQDMEAQCATADPLITAADFFDSYAHSDANEVPEVHCMFRCRLDKIVGNEGFDRKTGIPEESNNLGAELEDLLTCMAIELYNWGGYANKPKGKMVYIEIYADQLPPLNAHLYHVGLELNQQGNDFKAVDRSVPPAEVPERLRLLTLFVRNRVAYKEQLSPVLQRQKISLWASPKSLLDQKPQKEPKKKELAAGEVEMSQYTQKNLL
jgi:hypothetical protein